jgi:hypothetical protein
MKHQLREVWLSHGIALVLVRERHSGGNLVEWATGISTEGAQEMQKGRVSRFQGFKVSRFQEEG